MISLEKIILDILNEDNTAGDALGAAAGGTSQFSSDQVYGPGELRIPYLVYGKGGVMTRKGLIKTGKRRKGKKRKQKRRKKK